THGHTRTATNVMCVLTDSHRRPVCASGHPRTSCPTWAKITQTVHVKGQHAESKDQRADMCTDGEPQTSSTDVLCVLTDTHGRPMCGNGHPQTSCPWMFCVCWQTPTDLLCVLNRQPTWAKITQTVHGKGQRAESKDQHADMYMMDTHGHPVCAGGHPRTSCFPRGPKSPEKSTGRASMLSSRTSVLICVLMHSLGRPVCADVHTGIHTDSHRRHVCADGQPRTATDILCALADTH
ncbi:unnamed protein product, partial [Brassica rapa]